MRLPERYTYESFRDMKRNVNSTRRAFTLIEVLVVIVVIAVLASFVAPSLFRNVNDARVATAKAQI